MKTTPETIVTGTSKSTREGVLRRTIAGFKSFAKKPAELMGHTANRIREATGKPVKQTVARIGLSAFAIGSMVGAGVGCGNQEKDIQEKPGITDTVDTSISSNVYSPEAEEGIISSKNKTTISLENAPKEIIEDKTNNTATLPFFPFQAPEEIKYRKITFNPSTVSPDKIMYSGTWWQDTTINRFEFLLPQGTKIYAPIDANFILKDFIFASTNNDNFISLYHYDPATDITYEVFIFGDLYPATPLTQYPIRPIEMPENWQEKLSKTKQGDLLFETRENDANVEIGIRTRKGASLKAEDTVLKRNVNEVNLKFPTRYTDADTEKLVTLENQA